MLGVRKMVDSRTDAIIGNYMQWTNAKTLTPEEYLLFRKQAIEETLRGLYQPVEAAKSGVQVEHTAASQSPVRPVERPPQLAETTANGYHTKQEKQEPRKAEEKPRNETAEDDALAFMRGIEG